MTVGSGAPLEIRDNGNGSIALAWPAVAGATGYNVYVNGVLNSSPVTNTATVSGLQIANYDHAGHQTPALTYAIRVTAVVGGIEQRPVQRSVTVTPTSIMLTTPMRRIYPFGVTLN